MYPQTRNRRASQRPSGPYTAEGSRPRRPAGSLWALAALALTAACESLGGGAKITEIVTDPPGALVRVEGYGECVTPCTVEFDVPRTVSVVKEGFKEQRFELKPGRSQVTVKLDLVAPTTDVEETEMPKL